MKRYVSALAVALCLVSISNKAVAASMQHELLINGSYGSSGNVTINGGENIAVNAGYLYSLSDMFQLGAQAGLGYAGGSEFVNLQLIAAVNFMMNQGAFHSVFIGGGAGWDNLTKAGRQFAWRAELGIRYKIFENVTWRPTAGVINAGSTAFNADLLAMSFVF
jgi:hypothetical protein